MLKEADSAWGCFARNPGNISARTGQRPCQAEDGEQTLSVEEVSLRREVSGATVEKEEEEEDEEDEEDKDVEEEEDGSTHWN